MESGPVCCEGPHPSGRLYRVAGTETPVLKCLRHALLHRRLVRTSLLTALVIGTLLTAINQGDLIVDGRLSAEHFWKIPLTYAVPYGVATFGALRISLVRDGRMS